MEIYTKNYTALEELKTKLEQQHNTTLPKITITKQPKKGLMYTLTYNTTTKNHA